MRRVKRRPHRQRPGPLNARDLLAGIGMKGVRALPHRLRGVGEVQVPPLPGPSDAACSTARTRLAATGDMHACLREFLSVLKDYFCLLCHQFHLPAYQLLVGCRCVGNRFGRRHLLGQIRSQFRFFVEKGNPLVVGIEKLLLKRAKCLDVLSGNLF